MDSVRCPFPSGKTFPMGIRDYNKRMLFPGMSAFDWKTDRTQGGCPDCGSGAIRVTCMGCFGLDVNHATCESCGWKGSAYMTDGTPKQYWKEYKNKWVKEEFRKYFEDPYEWAAKYANRMLGMHWVEML